MKDCTIKYLLFENIQSARTSTSVNVGAVQPPLTCTARNVTKTTPSSDVTTVTRNANVSIVIFIKYCVWISYVNVLLF